MKIPLTAHAKINLFLDITGRRSDGYHEIAGVMQSISLADAVTVEVTGVNATGAARSIALTCSNPDLPTDSRNLAWRAADAFFAASGCGCEALCIHIEKRIPAAAGMAGGSTDAAAVLKALNELCGYPLTTDELCRVGAGLGADVPFCIVGGAQITRGIGDELTPLPALPDCELVVACAGEGVSTPAAYRALDGMYGHFDPTVYTPREGELAAQIAALREEDLDGVCTSAFNLFESAVLPAHSVAGKIKQLLSDEGAILSLMSGSGPSVFGAFHRGDGGAMRAKARLDEQKIPAWICHPTRF